MRRAAIWITAAVALTASSAMVWAQPAPRPVALDDHSRLAAVADPQRSPDGTWVAYTLTTIDAEKDKRNADLWMVKWDGSERLQLTSSPDNETSPRWSPDGKSLAFLASRGSEDEKKAGAQIWLLNRAGGEAQKVSDVKGGVSDIQWSPDSTRIAFVASDEDPDEDPEKKEGWKRKTAPPIVIDRYHFKRDRVGYLRRLYTHIAMFDVATRTPVVLTRGQVDDASPSWSPDGKQLAFLSKRAHLDPDRTSNTDVWVVEAREGVEPRQVTSTPEGESGRPQWSPDGARIAVLLGDVDKYGAYDQNKLALVPAPLAGAAPVNRPAIFMSQLDRSVSDLAWSADGEQISFLLQDDRRQQVATVPTARVSTRGVEPLTTGNRVVRAISPGRDGHFAVLMTTPLQPAEIFALEGGAFRQLTNHNDPLIRELRLATTENFESTSKDGTGVHSILVKPAGYEAGRRYPMILLIHGGPNGQDEHDFNFPRQFLAAQGYVVLSVNYRGSAGRGTAFQKAIFADWGHLEVVDLLGAVDEAIRQGIADPARLGIAGWSYGGISTTFTIASDPRFKAAVSGAGAGLWMSLYGMDQYIVQYDQELGPPWKARAVWERLSYPFYNAEKIKTPTLFLGGEKDFNVPIAGGEQMYQALKSLGVPTELVIYPGQFHGLTIPSYERDRLQRYVNWFNRYLQPAGTATAGR